MPSECRPSTMWMPARPPARPVAITGSSSRLSARATLIPLPPDITRPCCARWRWPSWRFATVSVLSTAALTVTVRIIEVPGSRRSEKDDGERTSRSSALRSLHLTAPAALVQLNHAVVEDTGGRHNHGRAGGGDRGLGAGPWSAVAAGHDGGRDGARDRLGDGAAWIAGRPGRDGGRAGAGAAAGLRIRPDDDRAGGGVLRRMAGTRSPVGCRRVALIRARWERPGAARRRPREPTAASRRAARARHR